MSRQGDGPDEPAGVAGDEVPPDGRPSLLAPAVAATARGATAAQQRAAQRLGNLLRERDPELLASLAEVGVVRQAWVDDPTDLPVVQSARPFDVLQRAVESRGDRKPGLPSRLGVSALQLLSDVGLSGGATGVAEATLCFTDLEGFTRWTAQQGDERSAELLGLHYRQAGQVVRRRNGRVVKHIGDGLLLRFADPGDAVRAALDLVASPPEPLRVRAGVHVGVVMVERDDVLGHEVNVAARVSACARGGQVLVTGAVRDAIGDDIPEVYFSGRRRRRFKGIEERVPVCEARRLG